MKPGPERDYPIKVVHAVEEYEDPLVTGVYMMVLNHTVRVMFVPDVSDTAPPFDDRVPPDLEAFTTVTQARLACAMSRYVVTPNAQLAGREERFGWSYVYDSDGANLAESKRAEGVVFYVSPEEFSRYAADLAELAEADAHSFYAKRSLSALTSYDVVAFLDSRVVTSPWLRPYDAELLGLAPADRDGPADREA